jgi:hypothetical protein
MRLSKESWVIAAIGLADLIATIVFIERHGAHEANPIFRILWDLGPLAFIGAKILFLAGPIAILEWARRHNPQFVLRASQAVIVAYIACYGLGIAKLNSPAAQGQPLHGPAAPVAISRSARVAFLHGQLKRLGILRIIAVASKNHRLMLHLTRQGASHVAGADPRTPRVSM